MIRFFVCAGLFLGVQGGVYSEYGSVKPAISSNLQNVPEADETIILTHVIFRHGNRTPDLNELYPKDPYLSEPYYPFGNGHLTSIFRHGNRTPDLNELYPKDPYLSEPYHPFGNGHLTSTGKQKELNVGRYLRKRYNKLLGPIYYPDVIEAFSSDYPRTIESLKLVLAGLFPPRVEDLHRLPFVPFSYLPRNRDKVLLGVLCPNYMEMYEDVCRSPEYQAKFNQYENEVAHLMENTGLNFTRFLDGYNLFFGLMTEQEWGFELPTWTTQQNIWPKTITSMAIQEYFVSMHTSKMRQMATGYFLQKIIEDSKAKIISSNLPGKRMYLYSAHESNIAELLISLKLFKKLHVPNYGTWVAIEIHYVDEVFGVKVYYENHDSDDGPKLLSIPKCGQFCPLDKFIAITEPLIPPEELCGI